MSRVIDTATVPLLERQHVREGVFRSRRLLAGEPGSPGNFSLQLVLTPYTYYAPRHRHNFDQVRYQIEGEFDFDSDGKMKPGGVAYFPEGTPYGPQSCASPSLTLVLQFGGASLSGYLSSEQYEEAMAELSHAGSFAKGVFTRLNADGGKVNKDAYEAVWEHVNERPLVYPTPRYARPVFMAPDEFRWLPHPTDPGVSFKPLGEFSECRTRLGLYRADEGARLKVEGHTIYFVIRGAGSVDGKGYKTHAAIQVQAGEEAEIAAKETTELLELGLPQLA